MNIYEPLIWYDRERIDRFIPVLATVVPSEENGLIAVGPDGATYFTFPIRKGIKFQEGGDLTPEDVAYTFQRMLLQDRSGGPVWVLLEPIFGVYSIEDVVAQAGGDVEACEAVKRAVRVSDDGVSVVIRTVMPFLPLMQIMASGWGAVLDKEWVIAQGGWPGTCDNWRQWHDPAAEEDELFNAANGTGPYKLERWVPGEFISFVRNESYWRAQPGCENRYGPEMCTGLAAMPKVIINRVPEWSDRYLQLQTGDADLVYVPRQFVTQVDPLVEAGQVRMFKDLATVVAADGFFNFQVAEGSDFMPKLGGEPKPDFFNDINMRKAWNYSFNWDQYIEEVYLGEAEQRKGPIINGHLGYNPEQPVPSYDPAKAEQFFKAAWGGQAWEQGFEVTCAYNTGNDARKAACEMLEQNIEAINPKFKVNVQDLPWPTYLKALVGSQLAIFFIGWIEDYHDPHNWAFPYLHSDGTFAGFQHFDASGPVSYTYKYFPGKVGQTEEFDNLQQLFDELVVAGRNELDPERREKIYFEVQNAAIEFAVDLFLIQPLGRHYEQPWLMGWFYNPAYFGNFFYWYWKALPAEATVGSETDLSVPANTWGLWVHNKTEGTDVEVYVNGEKKTTLCGQPDAVCSIWSMSGWTAALVESVKLVSSGSATVEYAFLPGEAIGK
jgi:peptide/nickel transport system substrate-binding protein